MCPLTLWLSLLEEKRVIDNPGEYNAHKVSIARYNYRYLLTLYYKEINNDA